MTTITDQAAIQRILDAAKDAANGTTAWYTVYQRILDALAGLAVDPAISTWIAGASNVNANSGIFAQYIRNYTAEQYALRTGSSQDISGNIQSASNQIASNFAATLLGFAVDSNQNTASTAFWSQKTAPATATLPNLDEIGGIDAAGAAAQVFKGYASSTSSQRI